MASDLKELPMRALLAAAFITYMASAPEDVRQESLRSWSESLGVQGFDLRRFLSTESEQLIWKSEGLPSDDLSMENALVILQVSCLNWPHICIYLMSRPWWYNSKHMFHSLLTALWFSALYHFKELTSYFPLIHLTDSQYVFSIHYWTNICNKINPTN